jgi:hypothetical protein
MVILWRRKFIFEFFVAVFTFLTSFMYHFCDSIENSAWLEEHKWHRLDNIFSIQAFSCLFIYLTVLPTLRTHLLLNFFSLGFIMLMQEKSPWDVFYTIVPVLLLVVFFVGVVIARFVFFLMNSTHIAFQIKFCIRQSVVQKRSKCTCMVACSSQVSSHEYDVGLYCVRHCVVLFRSRTR